MKAYCFGHISTGKLYRLESAFPLKDGYSEIASVQENFCGEALSSGIVLNRLGIEVLLEGNWLGDTEMGRRARRFIQNEGIDDSRILTPEGYEGVEEVVFSDGESRTVFGPYRRLLFTIRQWEMPSESLIAASDIACADPSFGDATQMVLQAAQKHAVPYVAIDVPFDGDAVACSAAVIVSHNYLQETYDRKNLETVFQEYLRRSNGLVMFTFGEKPLWYGRNEKRTFRPPAPAKVVDTAGAGDALRAAIMYGLLKGMTDEQMVHLACEIAVRVVQSSPGVLGFHPENLTRM